jgi:hypothetical protein
MARAAFAQEKTQRQFNNEIQAHKLVDIYQPMIA